MGFIVAKCVRFYSMSLREVLETSSKRFFWLHSQIHRVEADEDLRHLQIAIVANSTGESVQELVNGLKARRGETETYRVVYDEKTLAEDDTPDPSFDREALHRLKARHN